MSRKGRRKAGPPEKVPWIAELAQLARRGQAHRLLSDPRLLLLPLEPGVFERQRVLRAVCAYAHHPHDAVRVLALRHAEHGDLTAAHHCMAGEIIWEQALGGSRPARLDLASHPRAPRHLVGVLATDPDVGVRQAVAGQHGLSVATRLVLAADSGDAVRRALAGCPGLQDEVARTLADDAGEEVRRTLAARPDMSEGVRLRLSVDPSEQVRVQLARVDHLPASVWTNFARDASARVRAEVAARAPAKPFARRLVQDSSVDVRWVLARRTDLHDAFYEILAGDEHERVRAQVASNPATPEHVVESLAADPFGSVATGVASHHRVSREALRLLVPDQRRRVGATAIGHRRCPSDALTVLGEALLARADEADYILDSSRETLATAPRLPRQLLTRLAMDRLASVRAAVARRGPLPATVVEVLRTDRRLTVRAALAESASVSDAVLAALVEDQELTVRTAARANQRQRDAQRVQRP